MFTVKCDIDYIFSVVGKPFKNWYGIILHHGASNGTPESYANYHIHNNKWNDLAYQFCIDKKGDIYISCNGNYARWVNQVSGAHCYQQVSLDHKTHLPKSANSCCIGICLCGDFYGNSFPEDAQYNTLAKLCYKLMCKFKIPLWCIYRHDLFAAKDHGCPGTTFDDEKLRDKILYYQGGGK